MPEIDEAAVDPAFRAYPRSRLADAALGRALELGASHAAFRLERTRVGQLSLRDARVETTSDSVDLGLAVRVIVDGTWGFAAAGDITVAAAVRVAEQAVAVARVSRRLRAREVVLADEPVHADAVWLSAYDVNPSTWPRPIGSGG